MLSGMEDHVKGLIHSCSVRKSFLKKLFLSRELKDWLGWPRKGKVTVDSN